MLSLHILAVLLLSGLLAYVQSANLRALELVDGESFVKARREPETENSPISVCLRIFPYRIKNSVIPIISIRLETLDAEEGFDAVTNRFLEVWMIKNGGRMKNGDEPFKIQTVHYNFKNNGDMGRGLDRYPYQWYHMCFSFKKTGPGLGEQIYYANGEKIFHGQNMPITDKYAWLQGNKIMVGHTVSKLVTTGGSLYGLLTDVQVFNRVLSVDEAVGYTNCDKHLSGDIADWANDDDWETVGPMKTVYVDSKRVCLYGSSLLENVMIIPAQLTYPGKIYSKYFLL
jgi:hypothetical protein